MNIALSVIFALVSQLEKNPPPPPNELPKTATLEDQRSEALALFEKVENTPKAKHESKKQLRARL